MLLRQDNADRRLTRLAAEIGLVGEKRINKLDQKEAEIEQAKSFLQKTRHDGVSLEKLLKRPETEWQRLTEIAPELSLVNAEIVEQVVNDIKYSGYVARQQVTIDRQRRHAQKRIPSDFDYNSLTHLHAEAREKLSRFRPANIDQAGRISGITPADIAQIMLHIG